MTLDNQYSELTIKLTKSLSKGEKKLFGIFITPRIIIERLFNSLSKFETEFERILEPSCGTCEIINFLDSIYSNVKIDGIEYNDKIFYETKKLQFKNNVKLINCDFMKYVPDKVYDLIIGNPPYFVCKKNDIPDKYHEFCTGRPNIFGLFIIHALTMLSNEGILAFVVPKSFLNSLYYYVIRNYIKKTCKILEIIDFKENNVFIDTDQATFGLIIQKLEVQLDVVEECPYSIKINNNFIFACDSLQLNDLFQGSTTLEKMGLQVRTGQVVWNEHKDELTDDDTETLLVYNTNISKDNKLEIKKFKNGEKGQYIKKEGSIKPTLVVNRGNGNSSYKLNYSIITDRPYLIENHLNEIYSTKKNKDELLLLYKQIISSFKNPKTQQFIDLFLGNNGLSKTELESIFPIYL
jgi:tRNA1(Val) A37 N6-methylase TrmN6